jgi:sugar phosphate isomerase/epimerase
MNRRHFIQNTALAAAASAISTARAATNNKLMIGMDHFSVRGTGMKAPALIDYAASLKLDCLFLSELGPFESFEDDYLKKLKAQADAKGLKLYTGGMSICKTAHRWKPAEQQGSPEAYLELLIRIAKTCGSPIARCVLGDASDRSTNGGIDSHIEECVKVLKAVKNRCETEGVKLSIENHAGDMQSQELLGLIEAAGKGHVGANIDPGNAAWCLEDPMHNLEVLGPVTNCSSVRNSMIWETDEGAMVQWTALGEGLIDFAAYAKRFAELAPGAPLCIETISGFAKPFPFLKEEFWKPYPKAPAASFAGWLALMKKGKKIDPYKAPNKEAEGVYQKGELERSVEFLRAHV